jgi:hypothetical protein
MFSKKISKPEIPPAHYPPKNSGYAAAADCWVPTKFSIPIQDFLTQPRTNIYDDFFCLVNFKFIKNQTIVHRAI